ncbi:hypothetical protein HMSSN139_23780 [Paenibacillus sp. HMSSN-139]|nr:hypothetical protein HMSSN139_23780 [Paenibacillus sp. HMSSN-139]
MVEHSFVLRLQGFFQVQIIVCEYPGGGEAGREGIRPRLINGEKSTAKPAVNWVSSAFGGRLAVKSNVNFGGFAGMAGNTRN